MPKAEPTDTIYIVERLEKTYKIEISAKTIVFTVLFLLFLQLLSQLRDLIFSLFIAFMIMSIAKPLVTRLERVKVPRALSALVIFILIFVGIGYGISWLLPFLISDMTALFKNLSSLTKNLDPNIRAYFNGDLSRHIPNVTGQVLPVVRGLFSNIVFLITTIFFSFYFILEENFIENFLKKFFKAEDADKISRIFANTEKRVGAWFRGTLLLMVIIGALTYIGLTALGVNHALSLAVIAGLLEAFPIIGPVIAAVPAFIFAVNQTFFLGISVLILYVVIQQLENNLIVPTIMKRVIGLNRILILIVLIAAGKLAGILGLFIAIPLTLCIQSILLEITSDKNK